MELRNVLLLVALVTLMAARSTVSFELELQASISSLSHGTVDLGIQSKLIVPSSSPFDIVCFILGLNFCLLLFVM